MCEVKIETDNELHGATEQCRVLLLSNREKEIHYREIMAVVRDHFGEDSLHSELISDLVTFYKG